MPIIVAELMEMPEVFVLALLGGVACVTSNSKGFQPCGRQFKALVPPAEQPKFLAGLLMFILVLSILFDVQNASWATCSALVYLAFHQFGKNNTPKGKKFIEGSSEKNTNKDQGVVRPWRKSTPQKIGETANCHVASKFKAAKPVVHARAEPMVQECSLRTIVASAIPTVADDAITRKIAALTRRCVINLVPEAEVKCIASCNLKAIVQTGDKPEIEVIVTVDPQVLANRLKKYFAEGNGGIDSQRIQEKLAPEALQKTATKLLSEKLNFVRYWRSQFGGPECLIVLLISEAVGIADFPICMNFSVNTPNPLRIDNLQSKVSGSCKELVALVGRWSRERGIKNVSRGQLNKYAWTLLAMHFSKHMSDNTLGLKDMFKAFMSFAMEWAENPQNIRFSDQEVDIPADKQFFKLPYIEDLYQPGVDAAVLTTTEGMERIKEEVQRAHMLLEDDGEANVAKIFERWAPAPQPAKFSEVVSFGRPQKI